MTPEYAGPVPGGDVRAQAIALAGLLAEQGITQLIATSPAGPRTLTARDTDLPGVIAALVSEGGAGEVVSEPLQLRVRMDRAGLRWRTTNPATARLFSAGG